MLSLLQLLIHFYYYLVIILPNKNVMCGCSYRRQNGMERKGTHIQVYINGVQRVSLIDVIISSHYTYVPTCRDCHILFVNHAFLSLSSFQRNVQKSFYSYQYTWQRKEQERYKGGKKERDGEDKRKRSGKKGNFSTMM